MFIYLGVYPLHIHIYSYCSFYTTEVFILFRLFSDIYLRRIVSIEENHDIIKGDRYLIELVSHADTNKYFHNKNSGIIVISCLTLVRFLSKRSIKVSVR